MIYLKSGKHRQQVFNFNLPIIFDFFFFPENTKDNINVNFEQVKIIFSLHYHFHDINKALSGFLEKK